MIIRPVELSDASAIADIYNHYILESTATFEETPINGEDIKERILELNTQNLPWYVAEDSAKNLIGYAYACKWKGRCAYRYSVEVSVYLSPDHVGQGTGSRLYEVLFEKLDSLEYHVAIGGITLPNPASIKLHEKFGMEQVAHFKEVGFKFGDWIDVGYWQGFISKCKFL